MVSIIAAMSEDSRAIGLRGGMPWRLPADMAHFRELTMGHAVIMGRVTWEPIAQLGLPGRMLFVLTGGDSGQVSGVGQAVRVADSLETALASAARMEANGEAEPAELPGRDGADPEVFIAGGASIYQQALEQDLVDRMYLTLVQAKVEADSYFPPFDPEDWTLIREEARQADERNRYPMRFQTLNRVRRS